MLLSQDTLLPSPGRAHCRQKCSSRTSARSGTVSRARAGHCCGRQLRQRPAAPASPSSTPQPFPEPLKIRNCHRRLDSSCRCALPGDRRLQAALMQVDRRIPSSASRPERRDGSLALPHSCGLPGDATPCNADSQHGESQDGLWQSEVTPLDTVLSDGDSSSPDCQYTPF